MIVTVFWEMQEEWKGLIWNWIFINGNSIDRNATNPITIIPIYYSLLVKGIKCWINPFIANVPFPYVLYGFLMFSEGRERVHWEQMG